MNKQHSVELLSGIWHQIAQRWLAFIQLLRAAWTEYERDRANYLAAAMIYYALVSLVPLLILLVSALGLLLQYSPAAAEIQQQLLSYIEASFGLELRQTIEASLIGFKQGSVVASLVGLVTLIFTASALFRHLRLTFRALWKFAPLRVSGSVRVVVQTTVRERLFAFFIVLLGGVLLLAALVLTAVTSWLNGVLGSLPLFSQTSSWLLAELSPLVLVAMTFGLLFVFLPPERLGWRDVRLATLLCTLAWFIAAKALELYAVFFGGTFSAYGAIGGLLVIMLWMNVVSQMLFFGAELCKVVALRGVTADDEAEHQRLPADGPTG